MPFVPLLPILSVFINFYLMSILNTATWIRFGVWMALGYILLIFNTNFASNFSEHRDARITTHLIWEVLRALKKS